MNTVNPADAHPFDQAIALAPIEAGRYEGQASDAYWNAVGPFGGITAATALHAVLQHPDRLGQPVALTVNYAAAVQRGPFVVTARALRTNRASQHWSVEMMQHDASGAAVVVTTASAVTALRRATWGANDTPMPQVPPSAAVEPPSWAARIAWVRRYQLQQLDGPMPREWDGLASDAPPELASLSRVWMRDAPPRPLDWCALAAMCDVFYPRVFLRRRRRVPAGTVSMTIHFHADETALRATGDGHLLGQARAHGFVGGFHDQIAQVWNAAGTLLATSSQLVYYKE